MSGPSAFQIEVARMFFSLPASDGFLLAGGGALLASGLTIRATKDLDFFGEKGRVDVGEVREQFLKEAGVREWKCEVLQSADSATLAQQSSRQGLRQRSLLCMRT